MSGPSLMSSPAVARRLRLLAAVRGRVLSLRGSRRKLAETVAVLGIALVACPRIRRPTGAAASGVVMAVVVDILGHVVVENLVVRGCGIDPDTVSRIAGRCAVVRDVIGLQQVRLGAKQQNAATRVV